MTSYYQDVILFYQRAAGKSPVVLHVEPDLWAYLEQKAQNNNASTVPVQVSATGLPDLAGLPNTAAASPKHSCACATSYAPNVILAYHFSTWGTGTDILYSRPADATVSALGVTTGQFTSRSAPTSISPSPTWTDRDAAFSNTSTGMVAPLGTTADDYRRSALYISAFVSDRSEASSHLANPLRQHQNAG